LKVWLESLTRRHPVSEPSLPGFSFGRVRQVPHRALVNRAARRLGLSASIPCADHESLAGGSRVRGRRHFMPAPLSLPRTRVPCLPVSRLHSVAAPAVISCRRPYHCAAPAVFAFASRLSCFHHFRIIVY